MRAGLEKEAPQQEPPYRKPSHLSLLDAAGQAAFTPQGDSEDKPDDAASWAVSHSAQASFAAPQFHMHADMDVERAVEHNAKSASSVAKSRLCFASEHWPHFPGSLFPNSLTSLLCILVQNAECLQPAHCGHGLHQQVQRLHVSAPYILARHERMPYKQALLT